MKPCIYVCETCRFSKEQALDESGQSGGQVLRDKILSLAENSPYTGKFEVHTTRCLIGCDHHCNLHFRAPNKICYITGGFEPNDDSAKAIVDYFEKYLQSETGQVPYKTWPQGIKGHFIARMPPFDHIS